MYIQKQMQGGLTPLGQAKSLLDAYTRMIKTSCDKNLGRLDPYHNDDDQDMLRKLELKWRNDLTICKTKTFGKVGHECPN